MKSANNIKKNNNKMTITKLAQKMVKGFSVIDKKADAKIDKLARMTASGFSELKEEMDKRFEQVDKRFEQVDKRFEQVDKRFDDAEEKFMTKDEMRGHFDSIYGVLQDLKEDNAFGAGVQRLHQDKLDDYEKRIVKIEQKIKV